MSGFIRRVVAGHDKDGKAVVLSDGLAPVVKTNPLRPGHRSTDIWKTSAMPVIIKADEADPTTQGPRTIHPPKGGTVLRIAELQPESEEIRNLTPEKAREVFAAAGNANAAQFGKGGRHPMMHRTESLDYAVVLEGEITLVLDDRGRAVESRRRRDPARQQPCLEQPLGQGLPHALRADRRQVRRAARGLVQAGRRRPLRNAAAPL